MKSLLSAIAIGAIAFLYSCEDEPISPNPTPEPEPTVVTYNDFVVNADQPMDSVVFTNVTDGVTEHIAVTASMVTCQSVESNLSKFHLTHSASTGDSIVVKVYHNEYTWGALPIVRFLANSSTVICDEVGGSIVQTSNGNSTTMTFTAN